MTMFMSMDDFYNRLEQDRQYSKDQMTKAQLEIRPGDFVFTEREGFVIVGRLYTPEIFRSRELAAASDDPEELEMLTDEYFSGQWSHIWSTCNLGYANWRSAVVPEGELGTHYRNLLHQIRAEQFAEVIVKLGLNLDAMNDPAYGDNWDGILTEYLTKQGE